MDTREVAFYILVIPAVSYMLYGKTTKKLLRRFGYVLTSLCILFNSFFFYLQFPFESIGYLPAILLILEEFIIVLIQVVDPGNITQMNYKKAVALWPYDRHMYNYKKCSHFGFDSPPRSHYCKETKNRIARFTTYSKILSRPIGSGNLRFYYIFMVLFCISHLLYVKVDVIYILDACKDLYEELYSGTIEQIIYFTITKQTWNFIFLIISMFAFWILFAVICYYTYLISKNLTNKDIERLDVVKRFYRSQGVYESPKNVFDHGFIANWVEVFHPSFP